MPHVTTDDGVRLYYEEAGSGYPIVFVHEFAGDYRSYETQMRYFSRRYRCIAFNARGYPPSDVPEDWQRYSQERARDDIRAVLDGLGIAKAHIVGISMGGFAILHFGFAYPERAASLVVAGCGYGAEPGQAPAIPGRDRPHRGADRREGHGRGREDLRRRPDPRAVSRTRIRAATPSSWRSSPSIRRRARRTRCAACKARRPSLWELTDQMTRLEVPTLIVTGDEDDPCLEPGILMKRAIPTAALVVFPNTGHALNLEEPDLFNRTCADFFHQVESGRWPRRDPRSVTGSILGM